MSAISDYLTRVPRTIFLRGEREAYSEAPCGVALKPGHLVQLYNDAGTMKAKKHVTYGGKTPVIFAVEDNIQGLTIDDAYTVGDPVRYVTCHAGNEVQARLPAAATAVVAGDLLISNGDGTLVKPTSAGTHTLYESVAASAAISNTNTETAFDKSYTIPANLLVAGDVITIDVQGIATATNSTDTLNIKLKIGSTTIAATGALDVANNDIFRIRATLVIRTIGASGTLVAAGVTNIGAMATATDKSFYLASTAVDTTATQAITVTATWSVASTSNSVRLDILDIERSVTTPASTLALVTVAKDNSGGSGEAFVSVMVF